MNTLSKQLKKEWKEIQPILHCYLRIFKKSYSSYTSYPITEIIHVPLFYGSFSDLHNRWRPS